MTQRVLVAIGAALMGASFTIVLSQAYRCIDSEAFIYLPAVLFAWAGAGLLVFGATALPRGGKWLQTAILSTGLLLLAWALAGPPFRACG